MQKNSLSPVQTQPSVGGVSNFLKTVLEWNQTRKSILVLGLLLTIYFLYFLFFNYYLLTAPTPYFNYPLVGELRPILGGLLVWILLLMSCFYGLRDHPWVNRVSPVITVTFYALSLIFLGYLVGMLTFPVGLVVAGAPLFGFILFWRWLVVANLAMALCVIVGLSWLSVINVIPYGPIFTDAYWSDPAARAMQLKCNLFFSVPHLIMIIGMCDMMLDLWRKRERKIRQLSRTDELTGLLNRRAINEGLQRLIPPQGKRRLSVLLMDLDFFKKINDTHGHLIGDDALRLTSACLQSQLREQDMIGRYGGEEFLVVLPRTLHVDAVQAAERCRKAICEIVLQNDQGERVPLTASFGVHQVRADDSLESILHQVDRCLYEAKAAGRNCVRATEPPGTPAAVD